MPPAEWGTCLSREAGRRDDVCYLAAIVIDNVPPKAHNGQQGTKEREARPRGLVNGSRAQAFPVEYQPMCYNFMPNDLNMTRIMYDLGRVML